MAKKGSGWGLAIVGAAVAANALINRRNRKKAEKESEEARKKADAISAEYNAEMQNPELMDTIETSEPQQTVEGGPCPNCRTVNPSDAVYCSFCSAKLRDSPVDEFRDY